MKSPRLINVVLNPFTHDSRVLKEAVSAGRQGFDVSVFAMAAPDLPEIEHRDGFSVHRFAIRVRGLPRKRAFQVFKFAELALRMTAAGVRKRPKIVHANDISGLPIGALIAALTGAKLVYDSHELWRDPSHRKSMPDWFYRLSRLVERKLSRRADAVVTVSDSIAADLHRTLGVPMPVVVRNVPRRKKDSPDAELRLRRALGIGEDVPVVLYQGEIHRDRGVLFLIEAFAGVSAPAVLVFMGNGPDVAELGKVANTAGISDRVFHHSAVPPQKLLQYTADATIGVNPIDGSCLNHQFCLPNKLFEYLHAGVPVLVTDLPEMASVVRKYGVGATFKDRDKASFAEAVNRLLGDLAAERDLFKSRVTVAADELCWEREETRLLDVYRRLQNG